MNKYPLKTKYAGVRETAAGNYELSYYPYKGAKKKVYQTIESVSPKKASDIRLVLLIESRKENHASVDERSRLFSDFTKVREDFIVGLLDKNGKPLPVKTKQGFSKTFDRLFIEFRALKFPNLNTIGQLSLPFFVSYQHYFCNDLGRPRGWRAEWIRVRTIYNRLYKLGYVTDDLRRKIRENIQAPERNKKDYPEIPNDKIKHYLNWVKKDRPDMYKPLYFMCRCGRRVEETTLIERTDVKFEGLNPIKIDIRAETRKKKVDAPLNKLDDELANFIRTAYNISSQHKAPFLFLNLQHRKMNQRRINDYLVETSLRILGIRITTHYFKHRVMTECQKNGVSIQDAMALTGTKNIRTALEYYSHPTMEGQEKALAITMV